jgi:MoaA/NifB/PqqE/SkfB family radical SAM enzyme
MQLQIETTNVCQADCVFCPYTQMKRPKGTMALDLFEKIVDEAATIPAIEMLTLTGLGETLLDRHLVARIRYARRVLPPGVSIDLYTNGNLLRPATTDALIAAGLDVLYVSLNATTAEKRREIMHLDDYDAVIGYITYAIAAFDRAAAARGLSSDRKTCRVIVKGIASKDLMEVGEHEQFMQAWGGDWAKGGAAYLHLEGNWAGSVGQRMRTKPKQACGRALSQIMVLWDGRVSLCCFDAEGAVILGNLHRQTIREIYNGQPALGIREAHHEGRRGELPLCATCTAI